MGYPSAESAVRPPDPVSPQDATMTCPYIPPAARDHAGLSAPEPSVSRGDLREFTRDPVACMRRLHRAHGDVAALEHDGQRLVFAFGPENNRFVQCDPRFESRFFAIRGPKNSPQRRTTCGLLNMNGETHRRHRRMVMQPFGKRVVPSYHPTVAALASELIDDWNVGDVRDLHADMTAYMLRVVSAILFGLEDRELAYETGHLIDDWAHMNHEVGMGALVSDPEFTGGYDRLLCQAARLEANVKRMIESRRRGGLGEDVLSLMIRASDEDGRISDAEMIGHVSLLFGAAHLTTAHTLTWTLFLLAQHPSVARPIDAEIKAADFAGDVPTPAESSRMPLLERALKESMRCLPASAYLSRMTAEPLDLGPLRLPRGTPVIFSQYMTHHMPRLYADPDEFRPDRWASISPTPYEYLPFGSGPRMCIGATLAMQTLMATLPAVLRRFRPTAVADATIDGEVVSTMLGPSAPVPIVLHAADGRYESVPVRGNIHDLVTLREMPRALRRAA